SYACKAIPLMNLSKLINVQQNGAVDSVSAALERKFVASKKDPVHTSAKEYMSKFMRDYAGNAGGKQSGTEKLLAKLRSNYSGAVLTLAGGTAIKQAASYPTAAAVVSPGSLLRAMDKTRTVDTSFIDERTAVFTKRTEGYSTVELAEMQQDGKRIPKALNWIQMVDVGTTKLLKRAAAIEVQKTTNLKIGTEEYKQAVTDMYIDIIEKTQPNYSTALRPDILRSDSALERALVMFATQPMQNFGILYDAFGDYRAKKNAHDATKSKATEAALNAAGKKLGRAVGSQIASSLVFSLMQYAYDWFRRKDDKYLDDDGNLTFGSFSKAIGFNMLTNGAGMFIAGKAALEFTEIAADKIVKSLGGDAIFNASAYGLEVAELSAISDAATSVINAAGAIAKAVNDSIDGEEVDIESAARKTWKAAEDSLVLFGIPLKNATTMLTSAAKQVLIPSLGKYIGGYYALRISTDPDTSKSAFYDNLWACYKHDSHRTMKELYNTMLEDGFSAESIKTAMEKKMKAEQGVKSVKDLDERWDDIIG
ncbi:MAG: hypothetical protein MJ065_09870, partial [Oscillospiraceae bacterium]|nr:hypothetical protein [Oscillospiraceae bacterium]